VHSFDSESFETPADCAYDRREALGQDETYSPDVDWNFTPAEGIPVPDSSLIDF
jgi:hypothetical protein